MPSVIPDEIMDLMAAKFHMLSDPTRLAILRTLMQSGELNVGKVVEETGRSQANVSKHLKLLTKAGLVARRKEGLRVYYRLDDLVVEKICRLVCDSILEDMRRQLEQDRRPPPGREKKR
jgi:ArsR family transcriptional regulator